MTRLDGLLADCGLGTRNECSKLIRRGHVESDGLVIKNPSQKIPDTAVVTVDGIAVERPREVTCMLYKTAGYVTSTDDPRDETVMDLLPENFIRQHVVPAGRLDKDTEGLLIFTNNGYLLHRLISPKHNVRKTYLVRHEGNITQEHITKALEGITLRDGSICKSSIIKVTGEGESTIEISQGMYHQVRRMYASLGLKVTYLKRIAIGDLTLGDLRPQQCVELTQQQISMLFS